MRKIVILLILVSAIAVNSQTKRVLFLGNSYIYVNDLPILVKELANADGKTLIHDKNTPGGHTLEGHSTNATSLNKINSEFWDFVVLQDQSQRPSFPPSQVEVQVFPYAKILADSINANNECTEPLFFMTWGRQNGDQDNCASYPPLCTYEGMQQRLRESYIQMGIDNYSSVSPVGIAWKKAREITNDTINFYSGDESHPSIYGSYLAACVFYTIIFETSPINNTFISTIPETTANLLQHIAYNTVTDSNYVWNLKTANFGIEQNSELEYNFIGTENYLTEKWDFGDGPIETTHNPTHIFANNGEYSIKHIITNNCTSDTIIKTIQVGTTNIIKEKNIEINIYPNPATNFINIIGNNINETKIYNSIGEVVITSNKLNIDISSLNKGIYHINILTTKGIIIKKFIKL